MAAQPATARVWIEDEQLVQGGVNDHTLQILLGVGLPERVERRGSATRLRFRAVYDRNGRYEFEAILVRSEGRVVAIVQENLYQPGDPFYIDMNGKVFRFRVESVRNGKRPGDQELTRVLELALD